MKILHVVTCLKKGSGGAAEVVPKICEVQLQNGDQTQIAFLFDPEVADSVMSAQKVGVGICWFKRLTGRWVVWNGIAYSPDLHKRLASYIAKCDIVHIHGMWQYPTWYAAMCARKLGRPYVVMPHGSLEPERLKISPLKKRLSGCFFDRKMLNDAACVWATAESERLGIEQYGVTAPIEIIPLGLDIERFGNEVRDEVFLSKMGVDVHKRTILYFSRITPVKGLDMLADAWQSLSREFHDWQLLIVGPDDRGYAETVKKMFASKCKVGSYVFHPPVYREDKITLLNSIDGFVLPTRSENWSISVAEAMASGKPVVCTKGAPWECLNVAKAGWWVDTSVQGIVCGLRKLMATSEEDRKAIGKNARKWICENLDWSVVSQKMHRCYENILSNDVKQNILK